LNPDNFSGVPAEEVPISHFAMDRTWEPNLHRYYLKLHKSRRYGFASAKTQKIHHFATERTRRFNKQKLFSGKGSGHKKIGSFCFMADPKGLTKSLSEIKEAIRAIEQEAPNHITLDQVNVIDETFIQKFQLMVVSTDGWKTLVESRSSWLSLAPSILILRD
jgi:hypothetical protein